MEEDQVSWGYIIVFIVLIVIIGFIFAKADNKRAMLKTIGLDLSGSVYDTLKEKEFSRRCLVALVNASLKIPQDVNGEKQFLNCLIKILYEAKFSNNLGYLGVSSHYINHALTVVNRRYSKFDGSNEVSPLLNIDYNDKNARKRYFKLLWDKYQYPWPSDWLKEDSF